MDWREATAKKQRGLKDTVERHGSLNPLNPVNGQEWIATDENGEEWTLEADIIAYSTEQNQILGITWVNAEHYDYRCSKDQPDSYTGPYYNCYWTGCSQKFPYQKTEEVLIKELYEGHLVTLKDYHETRLKFTKVRAKKSRYQKGIDWDIYFCRMFGWQE